MEAFIKIAYNHAVNFRDKYQLGNNCGKHIFDILELLEKIEKTTIKLIRTPLNNLDLSGFIGYKYNSFIIVTNTNHTLGSERFTIAHEIYHLLENRVYLKKNRIKEESTVYDYQSNGDIEEAMANAFAAELLMPEHDMINAIDEMTKNGKEVIDVMMVIKLQQKYGVDYIAITKRLYEIKKINEKEKEELNDYINTKQLERITKNLGYTNELNVASYATHLLQKDLELIKKNYDNNHTSYDDLVRIFGYLGCSPEDFGYDDDIELKQDAKDFMQSLLNN